MDLAVLRLIAQDPAVAAKRGGQAWRLWAACGLPDFRKVGPMHHARMVRRLFSYIGEGGHVPHEWFAAEVARLDNMTGDIEALADRLAGIRSWAYIAHRSDWLAEPAKWAERTREVESRLSDALHDRLTQRFVDRRTAVLVRDIGARGSDALPVTVAADGEVSVGPEPIGHLTGFEFRVDPSARLADKRLLLAAAERRLGDELERRAQGLLEAPDETFALVVDESGQVAVGWHGQILARLAAGRSLLEPALRTARALDRLSAQSRAALRARLEAWLDTQIDRHLSPLKHWPRQRPIPTARPGSALWRRCSPMPQESSRERRCWGRSRISSTPTGARFTSFGSASARSTSSFRPCSSPRPNIGAAPCSRCARGRRCPRFLRPARDARGRGRSARRGAGLRRLGREWIRIDLADRLASHARKVRSASGGDPVDAELATSVGLGEDALARLMDEVGFTRAGDAWRWRGRRPPRGDRRAEPSHAFAELAKLKKK